jgi:hypothetical protein
MDGWSTIREPIEKGAKSATDKLLGIEWNPHSSF